MVNQRFSDLPNITENQSGIGHMNKLKVKVKSLSRVRLSVTPWTVAYNAPPSMGFSRQAYRSGLNKLK